MRRRCRLDAVRGSRRTSSPLMEEEYDTAPQPLRCACAQSRGGRPPRALGGVPSRRDAILASSERCRPSRSKFADSVCGHSPAYRAARTAQTAVELLALSLIAYLTAPARSHDAQDERARASIRASTTVVSVSRGLCAERRPGSRGVAV
ncbi:hypothetical protein EVAR_71392_1 [Eumeta japonica]|uniref:Uncharacterized protein n=1 Tax=Eumeta variegata TaxID=151549 RepID=A0A4C2A7F0_EUMVA|nr:hypothetical protein EVAR_71392_1 [Eumeta japonica]